MVQKRETWVETSNVIYEETNSDRETSKYTNKTTPTTEE